MPLLHAQGLISVLRQLPASPVQRVLQRPWLPSEAVSFTAGWARGEMKIVAATCIWQRHSLARRALAHTKSIGLDLVVVGSEGSVSREIADEVGVPYAEHENRPLAAKWNRAVDLALELDPDAVILLGSDDLLPASTLRFLAAQAAHQPYVGLLDYIAHDTKTGQTLYWPGYEGRREGEPIGPGRIIHADVIRHVGRLWAGDEEYGMDGSQTAWMAAHGYHPFGVYGGHDTLVGVRDGGANVTSWQSVSKGAIELDWVPEVLR